MSKVCYAKITRSRMYFGRLSIRDNDGFDIRRAIENAGFNVDDKVVIISEEDYKKLILEAAGE